MLTVERVTELLRYDAGTGVLTWAANRPRLPLAGVKAGAANGNGYVRVYVDGRPHYAHRLAWMLHYQEHPPELIDHINGDPSDNKICNLRAANKRINAENLKRARRDNSCGLLGVSPSQNGRAWVAQIVVSGRYRRLGTFSTPEEAHAAYLAAKRQLHQGWSS